MFIQMIGCVYKKDFTNFTPDWEPVAPINHVLVKGVFAEDLSVSAFFSIELLKCYKV